MPRLKSRSKTPRRRTPISEPPPTGTTRVVDGRQVYEFVRDHVPAARRTLWLATADIKDMHVESGKRFVPFLKILADLVKTGVEVRLMHAKEPGPRFREDFDRFPELIDSPLFERQLCVRLHFKCIVIDGRMAYTGSANLTGAGMGAKNDHRRNFESGILTADPAPVADIMRQFDDLFVGMHCADCQRREVCPDPIA